MNMELAYKASRKLAISPCNKVLANGHKKGRDFVSPSSIKWP